LTSGFGQIQKVTPQVASGLVAGGQADAPTGYHLASAKYVASTKHNHTKVCYTYRSATLPAQYEVANLDARVTVFYHREGYWESSHGRSGSWEHDLVCSQDEWKGAIELMK
jgi:hypothetical protein